jgi:purine-binding chemotaxis protein CheW
VKSTFLKMAKSEEQRKLVGCFVGNARYGIDIMQVSEIVNPSDCIRVPKLPDHVIGMADHRGSVMPIIDLRIRFGLEISEVNRRTKWILVKVDGRESGLQVDRVTHVLKLGKSQLRQRPSMQNDKGASFIGDVFADEEGLVFQLDLDAVTRDAPTQAESEESGGP